MDRISGLVSGSKLNERLAYYRRERFILKVSEYGNIFRGNVGEQILVQNGLYIWTTPSFRSLSRKHSAKRRAIFSFLFLTALSTCSSVCRGKHFNSRNNGDSRYVCQGLGFKTMLRLCQSIISF